MKYLTYFLVMLIFALGFAFSIVFTHFFPLHPAPENKEEPILIESAQVIYRVVEVFQRGVRIHQINNVYEFNIVYDGTEIKAEKFHGIYTDDFSFIKYK